MGELASPAIERANPPERGLNREKILRAALSVIGDFGVDKVTHRSVATEAGVAPGTVTYHFATREDLVRSAFALYVSDYETSLVKTLTGRPLVSRSDITGFLSAITILSPDGQDLAMIEYEMLLFARRDSDTRMQVAGWTRTLEGWLSDPLERLGAARPLEAARQLAAICRGSEFEVMSRGQALSKAMLVSRLEAALSAALAPKAAEIIRG